MRVFPNTIFRIPIIRSGKRDGWTLFSMKIKLIEREIR